MACVWCEGDAELHEVLIQTLLNHEEASGEDLRRALIDFYSCMDCINSYHRVKSIYVQREEDFEVKIVHKFK